MITFILLKIEQMLSLSARLLTTYIAIFAEESSRTIWRWLGAKIELSYRVCAPALGVTLVVKINTKTNASRKVK
jgi:hypothetical protein